MSASFKKRRDQSQDNITQNFPVKDDHPWEYELPQEDDAFIPMEEWSKLPDVKKEKKTVADNRIKTPATTTDELKQVSHCPHCSKEIEANAAQCWYCGRTVYRQTGKKVFL